MYDLLDRPLVFIPVEWPGLIATEDGGAISTTHRVEIQVEILDRDEFTAWAAKGLLTPEGDARVAHELEVFREVAKGWRKIKSAGRTPEFSDDNILALLRKPGFVSAFGPAYLKAFAGQVEVRTGNSAGSPEHGPAGEPTDETSKAETSAS